MKEALSLADHDVAIARTRRLKRAIDLSYKRKNLQDYAPNMELDLFKREIYPDIEKIRARDQEYAQLNAHNKQLCGRKCAAVRELSFVSCGTSRNLWLIIIGGYWHHFETN